MRTLLVILGFISLTSLLAQDQNIQLISKLDNERQFELSDGNKIRLMGFTELLSDSIKLPSPTITVLEGDSIELTLWNFSQGAPHTIHLHGLDVNQANDGVPHLSFDVEHGEKPAYKFRAPHPGTYLYHCHVASPIHVQAGMYGLFIVKPKSSSNLTWEGGYEYDEEFNLLMSEIDTNWHTQDVLRNHYHDGMVVIDIPEYKPQHFLINGKSNQQLTNDKIKMVAGQSLLLRIANVGYFGNSIKFPDGLNAQIIASDGRPIPHLITDFDSLVIMPGERFSVLIHPEDSLTDELSIGYFNLNSRRNYGRQKIGVVINEYSNVKALEMVDVKVYPNPVVEDCIYLESKYTFHKFKVFDLNGRCVSQGDLDKNRINIEELEIGEYLLQLDRNHFARFSNHK